MAGDAALDQVVEAGADDMGAALRHRHQRPVAYHQPAALEDQIGPLEHGAAVGPVGVDGDVGRGAGGQMPAVGKAEDAGRGRTGHDRDLGQRVFAGDGAQRGVGRRVGVDFRQLRQPVIAVHQQPDQLRIEAEGGAVGMVGGQEHPPGIVQQQEQLQPDRPLQRVDIGIVAVAERHHAAAGVAFDVHRQPFAWVGQRSGATLRHGVGRCGHRLPEHHLPDVDRQGRRPVHRLRQRRGAGGEFAVAHIVVAVELDVCHVHRQPRRRLDGVQRRGDVAGDAQVAAMDMQRMGQPQLVHRAGQNGQNGARSDAVIGAGLVEVEGAGVELEGVDATGIHHLDGEALGRRQHPGDIVVDRGLPGVGGDQVQQEIVAAQHQIAAGVDIGNVAHFHVRMPGVGAQHRRLESGGEPHLDIAGAGGVGGGGGEPASPAAAAGAAGETVVFVLLPHQQAGEVDLAAGDVAVDVDGAGHHHLAGQVVGGVGRGARPRLGVAAAGRGGPGAGARVADREAAEDRPGGRHGPPPGQPGQRGGVQVEAVRSGAGEREGGESARRGRQAGAGRYGVAGVDVGPFRAPRQLPQQVQEGDDALSPLAAGG